MVSPTGWKALLRETGAVLAAILVAFGLDAWWEGQVQRSEALEALAAVRTELTANLAQLDSVIEGNGAALEGLARYIALTPADIDTLPDEELRALLGGMEIKTVTPELGALNAFLAGGYLPELESNETRSGLAGLPAAFGDLGEEDRVIQDGGWDLLLSVFETQDPAGALRVLTGTESDPERLRAFLRTSRSSETATAGWASIVVIAGMYQQELPIVRARVEAARALVDLEFER